MIWRNMNVRYINFRNYRTRTQPKEFGLGWDKLEYAEVDKIIHQWRWKLFGHIRIEETMTVFKGAYDVYWRELKTGTFCEGHDVENLAKAYRATEAM
jgi:hypothetical protein